MKKTNETVEAVEAVEVTGISVEELMAMAAALPENKPAETIETAVETDKKAKPLTVEQCLDYLSSKGFKLFEADNYSELFTGFNVDMTAFHGQYKLFFETLQKLTGKVFDINAFIKFLDVDASTMTASKVIAGTEYKIDLLPLWVFHPLNKMSYGSKFILETSTNKVYRLRPLTATKFVMAEATVDGQEFKEFTV